MLSRPLVLVHGLWDNPSVFNSLICRLDQPSSKIFAPHLPHEFGRVPIRALAIDLDNHIKRQFEPNVSIDILGFSMGGLIARVWLEQLSGHIRTKRFFSIGSPHNGTLTAHLVPLRLLPGVTDMQIGSQLISSFQNKPELLELIECTSLFCFFDLMVFPGWRAVLPCGKRVSVPVPTHKSLISHSTGIEFLSKEIMI